MNIEKLNKITKISKLVYVALVATFFVLSLSEVTIFAIDETNTVFTPIKNLNDIIFICIRLVGIAITAFGGLQFGLSFMSHDPSQRSQGIMCIVGGILIMLIEPLIEAITGSTV